MYKKGDIVRIKTIQEMLAVPRASIDNGGNIHFLHEDYYFSKFMYSYINQLCKICDILEEDDDRVSLRLETHKEKLHFGFNHHMIDIL